MSLISAEFDDVYFSKEDGLAETHYVFLRGNHLPAAWGDPDAARPDFRIFETGFGTGLNVLAAAKLFAETAKEEQTLDIVSVEKFPLTPEQIRTALAPWAAQLEPFLGRLLAQYPLRITGVHPIDLAPQIRLTLYIGDANDILPDCPTQRPIDAWFLDGFAPAKNPQMWTQTLFDNMARLSHSTTTLATFTAAGFVRRGLAQAGFVVEKTDGYGRKRDMVVGRAGESFAPRPTPASGGKTAIIGGGMAGLAVLSHLRRAGVDACLFEAAPALAQGASGNPLGLVNPKLTAQPHPHSLYYASAYAAFLREAARLDQSGHDIGLARCGSLHLQTDADKARRFEGYLANLGWHGDHIALYDAAQASDIAGISLPCPALHYPDSVALSPAALCCAYAAEHESAIRTGAPVLDIRKTADGWRVIGADGVTMCDAEHVVIANAAAAICFEGLRGTALHEARLQTVRGQISRVAAQPRLAALKAALCFGGYLSPYAAGLDGHVLGASFKHWDESLDLKNEDDAENIQRIEEAIPGLIDPASVTSLRVGMRAASKDRFPIVGRDSGLSGLHFTIAHGSHGLISSALAARMICADISGRFAPSYQSVTDKLSINRFNKPQ